MEKEKTLETFLVFCEDSLRCEAIYKKAKEDLNRQAAEEVKP